MGAMNGGVPETGGEREVPSEGRARSVRLYCGTITSILVTVHSSKNSWPNRFAACDFCNPPNEQRALYGLQRGKTGKATEPGKPVKQSEVWSAAQHHGLLCVPAMVSDSCFGPGCFLRLVSQQRISQEACSKPLWFSHMAFELSWVFEVCEIRRPQSLCPRGFRSATEKRTESMLHLVAVGFHLRRTQSLTTDADRFCQDLLVTQPQAIRKSTQYCLGLPICRVGL